MNLPATWMRGGTSKGLFLLDRDLPADTTARYALFARLLGSPDAFEKQTDGLGGATSSTSKVVVLKKSERDGFDVDFWFGQVDVKTGRIDASGTCGNLSAAVGPFAIWSGLVAPVSPVATVRIFQQNLQQTLLAHVPCNAASPIEQGTFREDGVPFASAAIELEFFESAASALPTGNVTDKLTLPAGREIEATLVTAGNPTVFIRAADVGLFGTENAERVNTDFVLLAALEGLRVQAAVKMGLSPTLEMAAERAAVPKIAWVAPPRDNPSSNGDITLAQDLDICARILSMNKLHHAFTGTGAIALACAARIPGSVVHAALRRAADARPITLGHTSGRLRVSATVALNNGLYRMEKTLLTRSARRLMSGTLHLPQDTNPDLSC